MPLVINSLGVDTHTHMQNSDTDDPYRINCKKPGAPGLKTVWIIIKSKKSVVSSNQLEIAIFL